MLPTSPTPTSRLGDPSPAAPTLPERGFAPHGIRPRFGVGLAPRFAIGALLAAAALPPSAYADAPAADPATSGMHLAWAVLAAIGVAIGVVGLGCAYAVLGAVFPGLTQAADRQARSGSSAAQGLFGSLAVAGVLVAMAGVAKLGSPTADAVAALALGGPALLLAMAGSLGTLPLLGERLLGTRGPAASPLRRAIVGSVALGLAFVPGLAFRFYPLALLLGVPLFGWPLGVAVAAWLARGKGRTEAAAPPGGPGAGAPTGAGASV